MRILVTNDDGVHAPGLAALTRALAAWAADPSQPEGEKRQVVVVAPMANHSGAGAAVGTVFERETISYVTAHIEGAEEVPAYGLDASPALSVIVAALGGFGPRPDLVFSGINLGVNVGRSVLHSGTVGATLTGAQLGLSGLAVSLRAGADIDHWETAATLAVDLVGTLAAAPERTVLNLNVPSVPLSELRGVRRGRISGARIIKAAVDSRHPADGPPWPPEPGDEEGEITLRLGAAVPQLGELDAVSEDDEEDAVLVARGWASLTPVIGVREDLGAEAAALVERSLREGPGPGPGAAPGDLTGRATGPVA